MRDRQSEDIEVGAMVVLCCQNPKEKVWGCLLRLDACGAVVRGLALDSVEDWLRQERSDDPSMIWPSSVFVPMHRVERIYRDETTPALVSYADRYREACGQDVRDVLLGGLDDREPVQ